MEQRSLGALVSAEVVIMKLLLTGTADTGDPGLHSGELTPGFSMAVSD